MNPLPVDVTTTWWDYVVDVADILAGLGAAGALIMAALAYMRQVDDARRLQASKITVSKTVAEEGVGVTVKNASDRPIFDVEVRYIIDIPDRSPPGFYWSWQVIHAFQEDHAVRIPLVDEPKHDFSEKDVAAAMLDFTDATGRRWRRDLQGALEYRSKRWNRPRSRRIRIEL